MKFIKNDDIELADFPVNSPEWQTMRHTIWSKPFVICGVRGLWIGQYYADHDEVIVEPFIAPPVFS